MVFVCHLTGRVSVQVNFMSTDQFPPSLGPASSSGTRFLCVVARRAWRVSRRPRSAA
jgi:hypothetical protein